MDRNRGAKGAGPGRAMSRGEFLGVGAAGVTGLAAAVGGEEPSPGSQEGLCATKPAYCGTFHDPEVIPTWTIDASILQILWGEIFPRLVALAWYFGSPNPLPRGDVTGVMASRLRLYRAWLIGDLSPTTAQISAFEGTRFGGRHKLVLDYFNGTAGVMPVRYHGPGAFDFILSDYGLDLFAPPMPPNGPEMLRYYEYRSTGQATLGLPAYLDEADALAFDVQSPTGPSQVWTDDAGLQGVISLDPCRLGALTCLDDPGEPYPYEDRRPDLSTLERAKGHDFVRGFLNAHPPFVPTRSFTIEGYFAAASRLRCWQLEGSVYRGIIQQAPRVVASVWREQMLGCVAPGSYAARFADPVAMRTIFGERLESRLPSYLNMVFEVGPRPGQPDLTDIEISNQGIRFPDPGAPPPLQDMLQAIADGRAGNPVFTDSKRPEREG